jgi:hypothetical protein
MMDHTRTIDFGGNDRAKPIVTMVEPGTIVNTCLPDRLTMRFPLALLPILHCHNSADSAL